MLSVWMQLFSAGAPVVAMDMALSLEGHKRGGFE